MKAEPVSAKSSSKKIRANPAAAKSITLKSATISVAESNTPDLTAKLLREFGLRRVTPAALTIRRQRRGRNFIYIRTDDRHVRDATMLRRFASLAVPPAYEQVMFASDKAAHLQAVGRDAAGRVQYRYHPDWQKVREGVKSRRLLHLLHVMPKVRRAVRKHLAAAEPTRNLALAAVIDLVMCTAIRAGSETYAREHGTRGATTLLKSHVVVEKDRISLCFKGKLGVIVRKACRSSHLAAAIGVLRSLPGPRLFQYRDDAGAIRTVGRRDVNTFLREIAGVSISLKDFRTLVASDLALADLAKMTPERSERRLKIQVRHAVSAAAEELVNTPTVCRKSYVHPSIVAAFESGAVEKFVSKLGKSVSRAGRESVLAAILAAAQV
jgi:DNA topoisomerase-1